MTRRCVRDLKPAMAVPLVVPFEGASFDGCAWAVCWDCYRGLQVVASWGGVAKVSDQLRRLAGVRNSKAPGMATQGLAGLSTAQAPPHGTQSLSRATDSPAALGPGVPHSGVQGQSPSGPSQVNECHDSAGRQGRGNP